MEKYDHRTIEDKWQQVWEKQQLYQVENDESKTKKYVLDMFPYPSGKGLHVGHPEGYTATDIYSRYLSYQGYNVLHPMGWDAFGLPAENYAIKTGTHPAETTQKNIANFKRQIKSLGFAYDWSREINTTDPEYYKWTQWIFLQLFKKGLAYQATVPINWCPSCKTGLANEEVVAGECDRCGNAVEKKDMQQWMLKITAYADRLLDNLEQLDWSESIKSLQRNWIGRSQGAQVKFTVKNTDYALEVFTTRPDTLFGATYMVVAPEHELIQKMKSQISNFDQVESYIQQAVNKSDLERTDLAKDKTGVQLEGIQAINPVNNEEIPVWVADYVLSSYGTGAIMAVPAHDERDFEFAQKFDLPIQYVVQPQGNELSKEEAYIGDGLAINSGDYDGLETQEFKKQITQWLEKNDLGHSAVNYKLRDWVFSRQRYWGEPIPLVHCQECGIVPVPEEELPLKLPEVDKYEPTGTGESPLAGIDEWVNTTCPQCDAPAKRETNTMPQWAGSSWYWLRYIDPDNNNEFASQDKLKYWLPVDMYVGGAEHAVLHLLYARFWNMVLYDLGHVPVEEPFQKLVNQGLILGPDGEKMSKSRGNVVNPDEVIQQYGADTLRMYEMFMGPFEDDKPWDTQGIVGVRRFLDKVYKLKVTDDKFEAEDQLVHQTIKKVTQDIENFDFNTAISSMMILLNEIQTGLTQENYEKFLIILSPFAPHLTEELWHKLGHADSIFKQSWPEYDEELIKEDEFELVIQINGKTRDKVMVAVGTDQDAIEKIAQQADKAAKHLEGKTIRKVIYVPNTLINFVVS